MEDDPINIDGVTKLDVPEDELYYMSWSPEKRLNVKAGERVLQQIRDDPGLVTAQLRDAWTAARVSASDAGSAGQAFAEVVKNMWWAFGVCQQYKDHKLSLEAWSRMYDAGLPDLVLDIIMATDFWTLPQSNAVGHLFDIHTRIAWSSQHSYQPFRQRVLSHSDALWTAMWNNRDIIASWHSDKPPVANLQEHPSVQALVIYFVLYRQTETPLAPSSHMPHFSLHAWTTAKCRSMYFDTVYLCDDGVIGPTLRNPTFIDEAIIDGIGIGPCYARLADLLRGEGPWQWDRPDEVERALNFFDSLLHVDTPEHRELVVGAGRHRIPHLVATIAKKYALSGGLRTYPRFYNFAFSIIAKAIQYDLIMRSSSERMESLVVPGEDLILILSCSIDVLAVHGNDESTLDKARPAYDSVKEGLLVCVQAYYDWALKIKGQPRGTTTALERDLLCGLQRGAQEHWWPSLRALTAAKRRCEGRNKDMAKFGTLWKGFGALLGCNIKRERDRDASEAANRCVRIECEYHRKPAEKRLLRCKGCGVFYCSRDCQVAFVFIEDIGYAD
ncbi:unnamed protein product [Peniophora sp. CBMAI 1063]|nr:unnamed protein product [Peniophora sp. CBMAI 1063]